MEFKKILVSGEAHFSARTRSVYSVLKSFSDIRDAPFKPRVMMILAGFFKAARSETGRKYVVFFSLQTERFWEYASKFGSAFSDAKRESERAIFFFEASHMENVHLSPVHTRSSGRRRQNLKEFVVESPRKTVSEMGVESEKARHAFEGKNVKNMQIIKGRTQKRKRIGFLFMVRYQNIL